MYKLNDLKNLKKGKKRELLGLKNEKGINYYKAIALKKVMQTMTIEENAFIEEMNVLLKDEFFLNHLQKEEEIKSLYNNYVSFKEVFDKLKESKQTFEIINSNFSQFVEIEDEIIKVSIDLFIKTEDQYLAISIKNKENPFKLRGQSEETRLSENFEVHLLQLAGENYIKEHSLECKIVFGGFFFLKKNEKAKEEDRIILENGCKEKLDTIKEKILNVLKGKLNLECLKSECSFCNYKNICNYEEVTAKTSEKKENKENKLVITNQQRKIINTEYGFIRVNAGAGTGKSTTTALRTIRLLKDGYNEEDILLITFTNNGAKEINDKMIDLAKIKNYDYKNKVVIKTFNDFGNSIINEFYKELGFSTTPKIIEKFEKITIINNILLKRDKIKGLNYKNPLMNLQYAKGSIIQVASYIDDIKLFNIQSPFEIALSIEIDNDIIEEIYSIYLEYNRILLKRNLIDFNDQINMALKLLKTNDKVLKTFNYSHIIIDEFQDTDLSQMEIITQLIKGEKFTSLMVVGDSKQAIYSFKGVSSSNILNFDKKFKDVDDLDLTNNYRSCKQIIEFANKFIKINKNEIGLDLKAKKESEGNVTFGDDIVKAIIELNDYKNSTIICRTKAELNEYKKELKKNNIPNVVVFPEILYQNNEVNLMCGLAKYLNNCTNTLNFAEYVQLIKRNDYLKALNKKDFIENEISIFNKENNIENLSNSEKANLFLLKLTEIENKSNALKVFKNELSKRQCITIGQILNSIKELIELQADIFIEKDEKDYDAVKLITAHSSKGQEYDNVFLSMKGFNFNKNEEEEVRLFYVSMTRAKERLFIKKSFKNSYGKSNIYDHIKYALM